MTLSPLPTLMIEPLVRAALLEDLGRAGDITSDATIPANKKWHAALVARQAGVVAGLDLAAMAFSLMDAKLLFTPVVKDGQSVKAGQKLANIKGTARAILGAERVALNFLSHLSGIATATSRLVTAVRPYKTAITCTRKTTPGLRLLEKYAVRAGGGQNHRFGLDDAILIKDNHIAVAGGIAKAVKLARQNAGHLVRIEVEVDTLDQLRELLRLPVDAVLLDNMDNQTLRKAVSLVNKKMITEASGRVTIDTVAAIAATGVDIISSGSLTHSAAILDIGLDTV